MPRPPENMSAFPASNHLCRLLLPLAIVATYAGGVRSAFAAELTILLDNAKDVVQVGLLDRWDRDGNPRVPVDPQALIDAPLFAFTARQGALGSWTFSNVPPGRYDLVIMLKDHVRIEGFHYPPVLEFDASLNHAEGLDEEIRKTITSDIAQARHYENKVTPLYMAGDSRTVRVLVQLLRDEPTSYDSEYGEPVATLRHEVWQYTHHYGAWIKEKRTRVLDRILTAKRTLRQWTWVWVPQLGGIEIEQEQDHVVIRYPIPRAWRAADHAGLFPPEH